MGHKDNDELEDSIKEYLEDSLLHEGVYVEYINVTDYDEDGHITKTV